MSNPDLSLTLTRMVFNSLAPRMKEFAELVATRTDGKFTADQVLDVWNKAHPDLEIKPKGRTKKEGPKCQVIVKKGKNAGQPCGVVVHEGMAVCKKHAARSAEKPVIRVSAGHAPGVKVIKGTDLVFDVETKQVYGVQVGNEVKEITAEAIEECKKNGWQYTTEGKPPKATKEAVVMEEADGSENEAEEEKKEKTKKKRVLPASMKGKSPRPEKTEEKVYTKEELMKKTVGELQQIFKTLSDGVVPKNKGKLAQAIEDHQKK